MAVSLKQVEKKFRKDNVFIAGGRVIVRDNGRNVHVGDICADGTVSLSPNGERIFTSGMTQNADLEAVISELAGDTKD